VFSPGTPVCSTTITGRHDIAEILLKVALKHQNQIKSNQSIGFWNCSNSLVFLVFHFTTSNSNRTCSANPRRIGDGLV
jgi:hypothetical protein